MTVAKRLFDVALAGLLLIVLAPLMLAISIVLLLREGLPLFYASERMKTPSEPFTLWKFRTMRMSDENSGVTGADKASRITSSGQLLRRYRLDELPQLFNILRGDISFVGPRPPLRLYVDAAPELYAEVLRARPGLTGLATLTYHRHEAAILARCIDAKDTHETYLRRCVPTKAALDLIYLRNRTFRLDLWILGQTLLRLIRR